MDRQSIMEILMHLKGSSNIGTSLYQIFWTATPLKWVQMLLLSLHALLSERFDFVPIERESWFETQKFILTSVDFSSRLLCTCYPVLQQHKIILRCLECFTLFLLSWAWYFAFLSSRCYRNHNTSKSNDYFF